MKIFKAEIDRLSAEHGLPTIPVKVNNRLSRAIARTRCSLFAPISMDVCNTLTKMHPDAQIETARHEFAHALEWYHHNTAGHGARWKMYAKMLGAVPKSSTTEEQRIQATERTR